jgi:hypothetical protein
MDETLRINSTFAEYLKPPEVDESKPHQIVRLYNSCNQTHIVFDRGHKPVQVRPGEHVEADMLVEAIEYLRSLRREPRPLISRPNDRGVWVLMPAPLHPIVITDVAPAPPGSASPAPAAAPVDDTQLARMNDLAKAGERDH